MFKTFLIDIMEGFYDFWFEFLPKVLGWILGALSFLGILFLVGSCLRYFLL